MTVTSASIIQEVVKTKSASCYEKVDRRDRLYPSYCNKAVRVCLLCPANIFIGSINRGSISLAIVCFSCTRTQKWDSARVNL